MYIMIAMFDFDLAAIVICRAQKMLRIIFWLSFFLTIKSFIMMIHRYGDPILVTFAGSICDQQNEKKKFLSFDATANPFSQSTF